MMTISDISFVFWSLFINPAGITFIFPFILAYKLENTRLAFKSCFTPTGYLLLVLLSVMSLINWYIRLKKGGKKGINSLCFWYVKCNIYLPCTICTLGSIVTVSRHDLDFNGCLFSMYCAYGKWKEWMCRRKPGLHKKSRGLMYDFTQKLPLICLKGWGRKFSFVSSVTTQKWRKEKARAS